MRLNLILLAHVKPNIFIPAFAQPIAVFDLDLDDTFNADLEKYILGLKDLYKYSARTNVGGWRNQGNLLHGRHPRLVELEKMIKLAAVAFLKSCSIDLPTEGKFISVNAWANVNETGHYNSPHRHLGADVCGSYYVTQPSGESKTSGNIEFLDNRNIAPQQQRFGGPVFRTAISLKPNPGQLIVFPSFLTHWVTPTESSDPRIVIAWNARIHDNERLA